MIVIMHKIVIHKKIAAVWLQNMYVLRKFFSYETNFVIPSLTQIVTLFFVSTTLKSRNGHFFKQPKTKNYTFTSTAPVLGYKCRSLAHQLVQTVNNLYTSQHVTAKVLFNINIKLNYKFISHQFDN